MVLITTLIDWRLICLLIKKSTNPVIGFVLEYTEVFV